MKTTVLIGLFVLALFACAGNTPSNSNTPPPPPPVQTTTLENLTGHVVDRKGGAAVVGATVGVPGTNLTTTTDLNGAFKLTVPSNVTTLEISKPKMASVRVEGFDLQAGPVSLEEVMRPLFDPAINATAPEVTLDITSGQEFTDAINVRVQATVATPDKNRSVAALVGLGSAGGSSGYLNRGAVRARDLAFDGDEVITLKGAGLLPYAGTPELHVVVYDAAYNRTHLIRKIKLNVTPTAASSDPAAAKNVFATAITFPDYATFGAFSVRPQATNALQAMARGDDATALDLAAPDEFASTQAMLKPQAASDGTLLWVTLDFDLDPDRVPATLEVLRSFDGTNFSVIGRTEPAALILNPVNPALGMQFRDSSAALRPGQKTYYKIASVTGSARAESGVVSTTPLPRYSVQLVLPGALATGVSRSPTYRWESTGASARQLAKVIVLDRLQSEGSGVIWVGPNLFDRNSVVHNVDGAAREARLQANHAYSWQLAAITFPDERNAKGQLQPSAFSIAADLFALYANITGVGDPATGEPFPVQTGPVAEFVTGGL